MKTKVIIAISSCLALIIIFYQFKNIRDLKSNLKTKQNQLDKVAKQNEANIEDIIKRDEEIKNNNNQIVSLFKELEEIANEKKQDCINSNVLDSVKQLLGEKGI